MPETSFFHGSRYYDLELRQHGWGDLFGLWFKRQGRTWEVSFALFGRTFWFGCKR